MCSTRLVAIMNVYGLRDLLTFNGADFTRYTPINVIEPAAIR
jgi:hypothetical protein